MSHAGFPNTIWLVLLHKISEDQTTEPLICFEQGGKLRNFLHVGFFFLLFPSYLFVCLFGKSSSFAVFLIGSNI